MSLLHDLLRVWFPHPDRWGFTSRLLAAYRSWQERYYDVDIYGRDPVILDAVRPFFQWLYATYWRVQVHGVEAIPATGRVLIVANHSGALPYDAAMIHLALYNEHPAHRCSRFLVDDFVYYLPFLGTFINRAGGVRACPENAERLLRAGEAVVAFPEGIKGLGKLYRDRYRLARFGRGGVARVAIRTGAPIIPCAVIGAEEIHPIVWKSPTLAKPFGLPYLPVTPTFPWLGALGLIPLPSQWWICFGEPIRVDHYSPAKANDPILTHALTERLRARIQQMLREGRQRRARQASRARGVFPSQSPADRKRSRRRAPR